MGGMDGFGPVVREENEPVFHSDWERRIFALTLLCQRAANIDEFRHAIERIAPPRYLNASYYERWLEALLIVLMEKGVLTREELEACGAQPPLPAQPPNPPQAPTAVTRPRARFRPGDRVVARNINPPGHTRLARYVRGRHGVILRNWGVFPFPDTNAHGAGPCAQHVYCVAFRARELWGAGAPARDTVHIDLWEDYLDARPASPNAAQRKANTASVRARTR